MLKFIGALLGNVIINLNTVAPNLDKDILLMVFNLCRHTLSSVDAVFGFGGLGGGVLFLIPLTLNVNANVVVFDGVTLCFFSHFSVRAHFAFFNLIINALPLFVHRIAGRGHGRNGGFPLNCIFVVLNTTTFNLLLACNMEIRFPRVRILGPVATMLLKLIITTSCVVPKVSDTMVLACFNVCSV